MSQFIESILSQALASPNGTMLTFEDRGTARAWRSKAYRIIAKLNAELEPTGHEHQFKQLEIKQCGAQLIIHVPPKPEVTEL